MLFLAAIDKFKQEELLDLVAFGQAVTFTATMRESTETALAQSISGLRKAGLAGSRFLADLRDRARNYGGGVMPVCARGFDAASDSLAWASRGLDQVSFSPFQLADCINQEREKLLDMNLQDLRQQLIDLLGNLAGVSGTQRSDPKVISLAILKKAAKTLGVQVDLVAPEEVERLVCEKHVAKLLEQIRERLAGGGPEMERQLEIELYGLLNEMSAGEQEAIRRAMGLDRLTATAMMGVLKSGGIVLAGLGSLNAVGFGLFLAATTMLKAFTLLTGIGLGFGFYAGTTVFLSCLTGPAGILISMLAVSSSVGIWHYYKYRQVLLLNLMCAMHYRLLS